VNRARKRFGYATALRVLGRKQCTGSAASLLSSRVTKAIPEALPTNELDRAAPVSIAFVYNGIPRGSAQWRFEVLQIA